MIGLFFLGLLTVAAPRGERPVRVGDVPSYTFASAPRNGVLVRSLEDLRGRPALFEYWGPRCPNCVQNAVPVALKLQETWGEDLQVVLVEVQGAGADEALRFALRQRWLGGRAAWTSESPFWPGGNLLPAAALLGNQGQVLWKGNPLTQSREIERLVAEQVRLRRDPPESAPEALRPAWSECLRGNLDRAVRIVDEVERHGADDAETLARLKSGVADLRRGIDARFARVTALVEAGMLDEADARIDALRAGTKDDPALRARVAELVDATSSASARTEREATRQLSRLLSRFYESGGDPSTARGLIEFAERNPGTKAAARATDWARLATAPGNR